jgi:hypothetical protein
MTTICCHSQLNKSSSRQAVDMTLLNLNNDVCIVIFSQADWWFLDIQFNYKISVSVLSLSFGTSLYQKCLNTLLNQHCFFLC